jgi:nicotinate-nucleotide adenylyltransferase
LHYYKPLTNKRHVGVLGGTFDPVHFGHLVIAEEAYATLNLAKMVFVPAGQPPHKPGQIVTPAHDRLIMLELAIASNPHFVISRVDLDRPGPSYTVETLRLLREQWGEQTAIYFVIGWDSLEDLLDWYDPVGILKRLDYLVAVKRPGYPVPTHTAHDVDPGGHVREPIDRAREHEEKEYIDRLEKRLPGIRQRLIIMSAPQLEISATELRQRVAEGRPVKYQLPEVVEQYILQHGLYRQTQGTGRPNHG